MFSSTDTFQSRISCDNYITLEFGLSGYDEETIIERMPYNEQKML